MIDYARLRASTDPDFRPTCSTCGSPMLAILYRVFKCPGSFKNGRRWEKCPNPEQWEMPNKQLRGVLLGLLDQVETSPLEACW